MEKKEAQDVDDFTSTIRESILLKLDINKCNECIWEDKCMIRKLLDGSYITASRKVRSYLSRMTDEMIVKSCNSSYKKRDEK